MVAVNPHRLDRNVLPSRYRLELTPDIGAATFDGQVTIEVAIGQPTAAIVLNAAELELSSAVVHAAGTDHAATVSVDAESERATLQLSDTVPAGEASIRITFSGLLNDQLHGFYRSTFVDADGQQAVIATTQFESTDARRAFPCFDEPDFKATFEVTLVIPEELFAVSSGRELSSEPSGDGRRRVRFAETMVMPPYVLAWGVGPFEATAAVDVQGVPLRVIAPVGRAALTPFALEVGAHALRYLSSYFALPYPSDKIDHVAIPDFAFGAMENLGCVTYREILLLADLARASKTELLRITEVICHETAHMWFGDLVTMKWWNGIWLNEAFATFMELKATEAFRPKWEVWSVFAGGKAAALATDGLTTTRPIEFPVGSPEEAEAMFDVLTYQKGGSVLRMLEQYLGEETFRQGISRYLQAHQHANTETTDLWDALEEQSGEPVRATMDSWILQGGHPLVSVDLDAAGTGVELSQRRFLYAGRGEETWSVPVNLRASVGGQIVHRRVLLEGAPQTVSFDGPVDWVVINEGGWGFYRVRYSAPLLERLAADLQGICTPLERLSLVGDTWAAIISGRAPLSAGLSMLRQLGDETDPDVWAAVAAPLALLDLIADEADRPALAAFVRQLAGPTFAHLGWEPAPGESDRAGVLRGQLLALLGTVGADPGVRAEARDRLERFQTDPSALASDVLSPTVAVVAATGGRDNYDLIRALLKAAETPQDEMRYLMALAGFPDPDILAATLDSSLTDEVRAQDGPFLITSILANRAGGGAAWNWFEAHHEAILERFPRNMLVRAVEGIVRLVDPEVATQVHTFFDRHDLPVGGPRLAQLLERMDVNSAFGGRARPELAKALQA